MNAPLTASLTPSTIPTKNPARIPARTPLDNRVFDRASNASMKTALALLQQALSRLNQASNLEESGHQSAQQLMRQAQAEIAGCAEFQEMLIEIVPERWRLVTEQRLLKQLYRCSHVNCVDLLAAWCEQVLKRTVASLEIDEALIGLIQQIQPLPKRSRDRRNLIPVLLTQLQNSGKITTCIPNLPAELYSEALHETMLWFCEHLDEYDPTRASPVVWFNRNLFYAASKIKRSHYRKLPNKFTASEQNAQLQGAPDAYELLIQEAEHQILEDLYDWVRQDPSGQLKQTALRDRLDLNAQTIIKAVLDHIYKLISLSKASAQLYEMFAEPAPAASIAFEQPTDLTQLLTHLSSRWQYPYDKLRRFWREQCQPQIGDFLQQSGNR